LGRAVILLGAVVLVAAILISDRDPVAKRPTPLQSPTKAQVLEQTSQSGTDSDQTLIGGRARSSFDARARAESLSALRASKLKPDWSQLLKRYADGDQAAFQELLAAITPENALDAWATARTAKLSPADRSKFYQTLGLVGGKDMIRHLIDLGDPNAALAVKGWAQSDPAGALDWFRQLDVDRDPWLQRYLEASHLVKGEFLDRLAESVLDSLHPAKGNQTTEVARDAFSEQATRLLESLADQNPAKADAMMRELTERYLTLYGPDAVFDWFNQLTPSLQSAAIQRIIEAGTFKDNPLKAVEIALSQTDPKTRQNAISAAFGQLGSGAGGVDQGAIANQLNTMPAGRDKDFAINGFAHGLVGSSPGTALEWAGSITEAGFREVVVRNVTRRIEARSAKNGK